MNLNENEQEYIGYGGLVLRVSLGIVLIAHSLYLKLMVFTLGGTANFFVSVGLPGWLAYVVFLIEAVAGIALILGYKSRWFAFAVVPVLFGAAWVHWPNGWLFTSSNGGWEYPVFLAFIAISVGLIGDGAYALNRKFDFKGTARSERKAVMSN